MHCLLLYFRPTRAVKVIVPSIPVKKDFGKMTEKILRPPEPLDVLSFSEPQVKAMTGVPLNTIALFLDAVGTALTKYFTFYDNYIIVCAFCPSSSHVRSVSFLHFAARTDLMTECTTMTLLVSLSSLFYVVLISQRVNVPDLLRLSSPPHLPICDRRPSCFA
jgi:hypothetical protein